jgi:uncharacterized repeat protein (TIGR01451 family)
MTEVQMKRLLVVLLMAIVVTNSGSSAEKYSNVSVKYKNATVAFVHQPLKTDPKLLPLIDGVVTSGGKERFGIHLGNASSSTTVLEILDNNGEAVKSISVNDLVGKGIPKEAHLIPASVSSNPRRAIITYIVRLPQGDADLIVRAIATGDEFASDQQLVMTFALKTKTPVTSALRLLLPFTGVGEATDNGFVLLPKSGTAALAASVRRSKSVLIEKARVVITSIPTTTEASSETALLWFVVRGVSTSSGSSPTDAKTQALRVIQDNIQSADQPNLVIVNTADKEKLAKADTALYSIICANIGTGDATNVVLGNPIPQGATYVFGSATADGALLTEEKENQHVQNLKWTFAMPIKPGQEKLVSFKVVLQ